MIEKLGKRKGLNESGFRATISDLERDIASLKLQLESVKPLASEILMRIKGVFKDYSDAILKY